jgi:hypothetical protein
MPAANDSDITLGTLVRFLAADLHNQDIPLPFKDQKAWHLLFYALKTDAASENKPAFLQELVFDWDAPYPKCEDLSDFLNALHVTANVAAQNPRYNVITVADDDAKRWTEELSSFGAGTKEFVHRAAELARKEFASIAV